MTETQVSVDWLAGQIGQKNLVILDGSWHMPDSGRDAFEEYKKAHIPGAIYFDIDAAADDFTDLPHMLPAVSEFNEICEAAGITSNSHIVVYDSYGLFSAARVWWTFRAFGHEKISILKGGLPAWEKAGHTVESGIHEPKAGHYEAIWEDQLIADVEQVRMAAEKGTATILDARPAARFDGSAPEPRPEVRSGHMPGAYNLPFGSLVDAENGCLKSGDDLKAVFDALGVDFAEKPVITSCGSGITACILSLGLHELGYSSKVYDGSWTEWGSRLDTPVVTS